jgi:hypothetical protein
MSMAEVTAVIANPASSLVNTVHMVYALHALSLLIGHRRQHRRGSCFWHAIDYRRGRELS